MGTSADQGNQGRIEETCSVNGADGVGMGARWSREPLMCQHNWKPLEGRPGNQGVASKAGSKDSEVRELWRCGSVGWPPCPRWETMGLCIHNRGSDQNHEMEEELEPVRTPADGAWGQSRADGAESQWSASRARGLCRASWEGGTGREGDFYGGAGEVGIGCDPWVMNEDWGIPRMVLRTGMKRRWMTSLAAMR